MLNQAVLMGRLTREPEMRRAGDHSVVSFTLAVDRRPPKGGGEKGVDFIDVSAWRGLAEFVCKYCHKGQRVVVHGSVRTGTYEGKDGVKRKSFEVQAQGVDFADGKKPSVEDDPGSSVYAEVDDDQVIPF
jgi:single-strand DNA-binding protein